MDGNTRGAIQQDALVKWPIRLTAIHRGQKLMEKVFQHTPIRIGRLLDNDVVLPFDFASRYHCEIRFTDGQWSAVDLGSKNGLMINSTSRVTELMLNENSTFRIQDVTLLFKFENIENVVRDFHELRAEATQIAVEDLAMTEPRPHQPSLLAVNIQDLFMGQHAQIEFSKERALQMVVVWHDQILDVREFAPGSAVLWNFLGEDYHLGSVQNDKTKIRIPSGCTPNYPPDIIERTMDRRQSAEPTRSPEKRHESRRGKQELTVTLNQGISFNASSTLMVVFRYVPKSKELAAKTTWIEEKLVHPLIWSGTLHGAAAVSALLMAPPERERTPEEPDRFATIIIAPVPEPMAAMPAPQVPIEPEPPMATPVPIVKAPKIVKKPIKVEPVPPLDESRIRKVAVKAKLPKAAMARQETALAPRPAKSEVKVSIPTQHADRPVAQIAPMEPAPVFEAKKVGALKMLSMLKAGPTTDVANVDRIQVSRAPTNALAPEVGREPIQGTGAIESKLNQSAQASGAGGGEHSSVAVGGKNAGGSYQLSGLSGKSGNQQIRGSVVGNATYTQLDKNEGLTSAQVMKVVQSHQAEIQVCYEHALIVNPDLNGRADFEWEVEPGGRVASVKVKQTTLQDGEELIACVKSIFLKMRFPNAQNGESTTPTIGLPFGRL